jgi:TolB protein
MHRALYVISFVLLFGADVYSQDVAFIQLTEGEGDHRYPVWSPTEGYLALESTRDGNWEIYVVRLDDRSIARFTSNKASDRYPAWDADSRRILFRSDRSGQPELHFVDLKNYATTMLGHLDGTEYFPDWTNDGRMIAVALEVDSVSQIVVLRSDGSSQPVAPDPLGATWPRWSPDDTKIAFVSRRDTDGLDDEIYVFDTRESTLRRQTNRPGHDFCPTWSPSGDRIAAVGIEPDGARTLRIIPLNQGEPTAVLKTSFYRLTEPDWSPDGTKIAVAAKKTADDPYHIFVVAIDR